MSNSKSASGSVRPMIDPKGGQTNREDDGVDRDAILSLISDDYVRGIIDTLGERSLSARELVEQLDASRATVYRRLEELESAGVVESAMSIHPDGHHRKEFRITIEKVHLTFGSDGVTAELAT